MNQITSDATVISKLLHNRYKVQYYQREYNWQDKQIQELIEDLTNAFLENYEVGHTQEDVENYEGYFLGPIILTNEKAIIDGQQRLSSITLLLIYLDHLQRSKSHKVNVDYLIFSEKYGKKTFSIDVPERKDCLETLYKDGEYEIKETDSESVINLTNRYKDIEDFFPEELKDDALPVFIEWLVEKVVFVQIVANSEQDAHKIFVAMNDRGLRLTPVEMLKGYLLSEITNNTTRNKANDIWKDKVLKLKEIEKDGDADFIKNWLRAQYAITIRVGRKGAKNEDFEVIGETLHKWVRENSKKIGLGRSSDFADFIFKDFEKFSDIYIELKNYSNEFQKDFEHVYYNADRSFTLQYQMILAAVNYEDDLKTIHKKIKIVSRFIDQFIARRVFNFKTMNYSSIRYTIFNITKDIRSMSVSELATYVTNYINEMELDLEGIDYFYLNQYTSRFMLHILARITTFVEQESGIPSKFEEYVERKQKNSYDIEHIWANNYMQGNHQEEFNTMEEFEEYRNSFGGLLILPKDKNRSLQDMEYEKKVLKYDSENLLARTLNENCYQNNPSFIRFMEEKQLLFKNYHTFRKNDLLERQELYKDICKQIWNPSLLEDIK